MNQVKYRSEIDGLRAVAVLLVFFNHLGVSFLDGGFIGVDIFFVISGFLITLIIKQELNEQKFSIANFYKKRVIRIAPAYFLVLTVTSIITLYLLTPYELVQYLKSAIASVFFVSNFFLWREVGGYFSDNVDETFLLHFWSLSVEEQFYVVWPIIMLLCFKYIKNKKIIFTIFLAMAGFSLICAEYISRNYLGASYYLPLTRAFELLIGALLVFLPRISTTKYTADILYGIAFIVIAYSAVTFNDKTIFPGFATLLPCLSAAILIYISNTESLFYKVLSANPLAWIGKISYPMYLWHWPVIVIFNILLIEIDFLFGVLIFVVTTLLSYATYRFIERPIQRYKNESNRKIILMGYAAPMILFVSSAAFIIHLNGLPARFSQDILAADEALNTLPNKLRGKCHSSNIQYMPPDQIDTCKLGEISKTSPDFLMVGDSISNHFTGMVDVFAKDRHMMGNDYTQDGTIFLPYARIYNKHGIEDKKFQKRNDDVISILNKGNYRFVIMGGSYYKAFNGNSVYSSDKNITGFNAIESGLINAIDLIKKNNGQPIIIRPNPDLNDSNKSCLIRKKHFGISESCSISESDMLQQAKNFDEFLKKLELRYPDLIVIDTPKILCHDNQCFSYLNETPLYRDSNHLNNAGSIELGYEYLKHFGNPFDIKK